MPESRSTQCRNQAARRCRSSKPTPSSARSLPTVCLTARPKLSGVARHATFANQSSRVANCICSLSLRWTNVRAAASMCAAEMCPESNACSSWGSRSRTCARRQSRVASVRETEHARAMICSGTTEADAFLSCCSRRLRASLCESTHA